MTFRPLIVIPQLIEQPTWGGNYIAQFKNWKSEFGSPQKKIGQSYELSNKSLLVTGNPSPTEMVQQTEQFTLSDLLAKYPEEILGTELFKKNGNRINLLIKFTQSLGNSFQLHIKDGKSHPNWKPKPESWYFLEKGKITLGIKENCDWETYKNALKNLEQNISEISVRLQNKQLDFTAAQKEINEIVSQSNPWQYVNVLDVQSGTLIDLSACGIHHSWEEDSVAAPLGNIVYEIQCDVSDEISTIRSFDKGKLKPDGSTRKLDIDDYFELIDRSPDANNPQSHFKQEKVITETADFSHTRLFNTKYYALEKIKLLNHSAMHDKTISQYNHIFVETGNVIVETDAEKTHVPKGSSCFIPACIKNYRLKSQNDSATILLSYETV